MRSASAGKARWVEPSMGSTVGLPDCWVPMEGGQLQVHLELKAAVITTGFLRFHVRPEQRREIRSMIADKVPVGLVIGVKGTCGSFLFARPTDQILAGSIKIGGARWDKTVFGVECSKVGGFWAGVNFIFLNPP